MKHFWINRQGTDSVILFFLGWGADEKCLARMNEAPCDVVALYDYTTLDTDLDFSSYNDIKVVGWSMGVFNAECFIRQHNIRPSHKTAIAGTCKPVDAGFGLLPDVCQGTLDNWTEASRRKFSMRMCGGRQGFVDLMPLMSDRSVDNQKTELAAIMQRDREIKFDNVDWDKVYISSDDLIFLPDNQRNYWAGRTFEYEEIEMPHFPFGTITTWEALIG